MDKRQYVPYSFVQACNWDNNGKKGRYRTEIEAKRTDEV
jgi:hypothetical protein